VRREDWPSGVAEHVDSGNVLYRARDYAGARAQFREAVRLGPDVPVAWFGLQIAEHALGNKAAADSAMSRAEALGARAAGHPAGR
jgi:Flp pilus assembly protein TadD